MASMRWWLAIAVAGVPITIARCSPSKEAGVTCTEIGCASGLQVQLDRSPSAGYTVEVFPPGSGAKYSFECPSGQCGTTIFFEDFTPDYVNVRIIVGTDTSFAEALQPQYTDLRPNGEQCPPACHIGRVAATTPP